jgi:hypothetical protein
MLRWVIAFLLIANLAAFAAVSGAFGPVPSAGDLEPGHVSSQVHPERLDVQLASVEPAATPSAAVVGAPVNAVQSDAASLPASGAVESAASNVTASAQPGASGTAAAAPSSAAASASATASAPSAPSSAAQ